MVEDNENREARIKAYAEALAFFIDEPEALADSTLKLFVELCKEKIAVEHERLDKGLGKQRVLANIKI